MNLSSSVKFALAIAAVILAYFGVRTIFNTGPADAVAQASKTAPFTVATKKIEPGVWRDEIRVRGRTEALRKVTVRAETVGAVAQTPATLGAIVEKGDILCRLKIDARRAALNEARASLAKAQLDYDAAVKLSKDGFRSQTSVASVKAALDLAKASEEQARLNIDKTNITAPFKGVFDQRMVELGDFLNIGDPCGVVIQQSPFLVTGAVSEKDVSKIKIGDAGAAFLATGETINGKVRFVATSADPSTRTFKVELEIPNEEGALKDGVTAEFTVFAARRNAHLIPRSSLTLDDQGRIGVRVVGGSSIVETYTVSLLGESLDGVWIDGLDGPIDLIVRGQDYVSAGQKVSANDHDTDQAGGEK